MRKYFLFILTAIFAITIGCKKQNDTWNGEIIFLSGNVLVNGHQAVLEQIVAPGTGIVTSAASLCDIVFNGKNIIRIAENSSVILNIGEGQKDIELKHGAIANVLKKLVKVDNDFFKIMTPTAVAAIRGTTFFVKIENENTTYICDCNGVIEVSDINGQTKQTIESSHHKATRVTKTDSGFVVSEAGMLYHDDTAVQSLADKIKVKIDWTQIDRNN